MTPKQKFMKECKTRAACWTEMQRRLRVTRNAFNAKLKAEFRWNCREVEDARRKAHIAVCKQQKIQGELEQLQRQNEVLRGRLHELPVFEQAIFDQQRVLRAIN